ncbi:hypothetical protein DPMN_173604 [Dreissena polymorpha]|uniref:Uncharacterized protein n=1 Tax=Dreissena polymorpha TaxID=45954 RepID=A0A9D4IEC7_DREPO|nr:hypothetical protein DPMN_173604 [Dreissena polymorpha]
MIVPPGGHVFLLIQTIIQLNLQSPSLTQMNRSQDGVYSVGGVSIVVCQWPVVLKPNADNSEIHRRFHVFQAKVTILELIQDIIGTNHLSKFHDDRKINVAAREKCPDPGGHIFQPTNIIFELVQDIIGMNFLTKFYEDRTINVASRVKNAPPLGSHVFQAKVTIFELIQDIIETNLLTIS